MQEFIYYSPEKMEFPLDEKILVVNNLDEVEGKTFLVSNTKEIDSEVVAEEVDLYIKNSKDSFSDKIKNVLKLYEIAANKFDASQDIVYEREVGNRLLVVGEEEELDLFIEDLKEDEFEIYNLVASKIKEIKGNIGDLTIIASKEDKDVEIYVDQIVWFNAREFAFKQTGSFDPYKTSIEEVLHTIRKNVEHYEYGKSLIYDPTICQYHERRGEVCGKCADVCPTTAVVKIDEQKHLEFSQIDCHGCGGCVSICPSGALDYAALSRQTIYELGRDYLENTIPMIIPAKMNKNIKVSLKPYVLPFTIKGEKFLHESTFLTLLQESGSQVIFYTDFLSKGSKDAIRMINEVFIKKYNKKAIYVAANEEELEEVMKVVQLLPEIKYTFNQNNDDRKREVFSLRLAHIVGKDDFGEIKTGENVHYAKVNIDKDKCTLCLACAGACNLDALKPNSNDNTLRLRASICTGCGYCETSCPEGCISITQDIIELKPSWFEEEVLAQDELFKCVMCGKEFATKKSIEKIAKQMIPVFKGDPIRIKTLYCCEDCKPKLMFENEALYDDFDFDYDDKEEE